MVLWLEFCRVYKLTCLLTADADADESRRPYGKYCGRWEVFDALAHVSLHFSLSILNIYYALSSLRCPFSERVCSQWQYGRNSGHILDVYVRNAVYLETCDVNIIA